MVVPVLLCARPCSFPCGLNPTGAGSSVVFHTLGLRMTRPLSSDWCVMLPKKLHVEMPKAVMPTKKLHGVDLNMRCFAFVGDPQDTATWQCCVRVLGDAKKTINAVINSLHRFEAAKIPNDARQQTWQRLCGAALVLGLDVPERTFMHSAVETPTPPVPEPAKPLQQPPAPAAEPVTPPEPVRVKPKVTVHKDAELEALIAESDRRADMWLRALGIE
jgi:hypothetical protein